MKNLLLILALLFFTSPALAAEQKQTPSAELDQYVSQMSDEQKAAALKRLQEPEVKSDTAKAARDWVEIGRALGEGIAATAERLGMVANDFAKSPLGKLAIVLIVWNYMGESVVYIIAGFSILIGGTVVWLYQMRKTFGIYNEKGKFIKYDMDKFKEDEGILTVIFVISAAIIALTGILFIANAV